jgi:hypothetical protein
MIRKASSYSCFTSWAIAGATAAALLVQSAPARAEEVSGAGKGVVGGGLLGGEIVLLGEAIAGVKPAWAYIVGGLIGAGGGATAGHFIEKGGDPKVSAYMLAGGVVLLIPTTVAVLQATSYTPPEDYTEDKPASGAPVPEPPHAAPTPLPPGASLSPAAPAASRVATLHYHWQPTKLKLPAGLLDVDDDGSFKVAMPAIELRPVYQIDEVLKYGLEQKHELRLPVFSATF